MQYDSEFNLFTLDRNKSPDEKSRIISYYRQLSTNIKIKINQNLNNEPVVPYDISIL